MTASNRPGMTRRRLLATTATLGAASAAAVATPWAVTDASAGVGDPGAAAFVDAVLAALRRHRLVAIGEGGTHGLQEHHDALAMLLTDPRLPELVDDVVVEFGNARYQTTVDRFTAGLPVDNTDLRPVWRDTTQSPLETWEAPVFEQVYRTIRAVNGPLPNNRRIRVLLGDPAIDWSTITTQDELFALLVQRDSHAASVVQREVLRKGRRALICYGAAHVLHWTPQQPLPPSGLVPLIEAQTGERVYTFATLVPMSGDPGGLGGRLSRYPRRSAIATAGTWLGDFDAGLVFPAGFRGADGQPTNFMCGIPLGSVIDAGVYVGRPDQLTVSRENPAIYLDPAYWAELRRRNDLQGGMVDLDSYRREQPARFTPQTIPPQFQCSS